MDHPGNISPLQLMQMARRLKTQQNAQAEADALEQLAQTGLSEAQQAQLHEMIQDKERLRQLLASPKAQALMQKLNRDGKQA
jgi:hypothetical protein